MAKSSKNIKEAAVNFPLTGALILSLAAIEALLTALYLLASIPLAGYIFLHLVATAALPHALSLLPKRLLDKRALFTFSGKNFGQARGNRSSESQRGNTQSSISAEQFAADGASQLTENLLGKVNKADKRLLYTALLLTASMGVLGAITALIALIAFFLLRLFAKRDNHLISDILPHEEIPQGQKVYERIIYGLDFCDSNRFPNIFRDVLKYGTESQKCQAIERMLRYFKVEFSHILTLALNDGDASVRVLAATAVTKIDKQYGDTNHLLQKEAINSPNSHRALFELAKQSDDYSKLDFVDRPRRVKYSLLAIESYQKALSIRPDDEESRASLVANYFAHKRYGDVIDSLEGRLLTATAAKEQSIKWYLASLFELGKFSSIRSFISTHDLTITKSSLEYDRLLHIIATWKEGYDCNAPHKKSRRRP